MYEGLNLYTILMCTISLIAPRSPCDLATGAPFHILVGTVIVINYNGVDLAFVIHSFLTLWLDYCNMFYVG